MERARRWLWPAELVFSLSFPNLMSSAGRVKKVPFYEKHFKNSWKETLLLIYSIKMHHLYGDTCKYRLYVTRACLLSDVHPQTNVQVHHTYLQICRSVQEYHSAKLMHRILEVDVSKSNHTAIHIICQRLMGQTKTTYRLRRPKTLKHIIDMPIYCVHFTLCFFQT